MKNRIIRLRQWLGKNQRAVWLEYTALSLFVLFPLLLAGYILTLDLVFTPHASWPQEVTNTYPLQVVLWALQLVVPGDIVEKIILFLILLLSGVGMHLLVRSFDIQKVLRPFWSVSVYFAGILYMINPFTYSRFMAGQWMVLLGYALLPFFVRSLFAFLESPNWKRALAVALWGTLVITVSLHHVGMIILLGICVVVIGMIRYWRDGRMLRRFLGGTMLSVGAAIVLSGYWLIPALLGCGSIGKSVESFGDAHFTAFATNGGGIIGAIGQVVRLQGFWAEAQDLFVLPQTIVPLWGVLFLLLWPLVIVGGGVAWRTNRKVAVFAFVCIGAGVILAATPLIQWAGTFFPFIHGYREPHKFVNLIVIGYALLGAFGVARAQRWVRDHRGENGARLLLIGCLCLPIILTPTMLGGFGGQLRPHSYPRQWSDVNEKMKHEISPNGRVLFLPWHQYAIYSFSGGRIIANPAQKYFEVPTIISDEPEFRAVPPTIPNDEKRRISTALQHPASLREVLVDLNVEYIILANEQDADTYEYLNHMKGVHLKDANEKLKLYHVEDDNG